MQIPSKIQFADEKLRQLFEKMKENEPEAYEWLVKAFTEIEKNAFCGIRIPKRLIPKEYLRKYGVHNLWKYNLPEAWRLLYSIEADGILVISIVVEWMDHKEYEKRFGY